MSTQTTANDNRKWAMLGGLGLGLALLGRRRRMRQYMMAKMYGRGFGGGFGPWNRFGGYGPWAQEGGPQQPITLPPFIEATLKAWHDRAHGTVPPAADPASAPGPTQV